MRALIGFIGAALLASASPTLAESAAASAFIPPPPSAPLAQFDHISVQSIGVGEPVVFISGLATHSAVWAPFILRLADNHRVIIVRVNGFNEDEPRANVREGVLPGIVGELSAYLQSENVGPASVVGHSMGGLVGMMLARDHPAQVRRLMVVDALPFIGTLFQSGATVEATRPAAEQMRAAIIAGQNQRMPSADQPEMGTMSNTRAGRLQVSVWSHAANQAAVGQALFEVMTTDVRPDLARIAAVPVTVLYARPPLLEPQADALYRGAYGGTRSIRLVGIDNSFHFIMLDQEGRFRTELNAFLAR